jgi:Thioredoxin-like domain
MALQSTPGEVGRGQCSFAFLDGTLISSVEDVRPALSAEPGAPPEQPELHSVRPGDHLLRTATADRRARTLIVYGAPGLESFHKLHVAIDHTLEELQLSDINYVVRAVLLDGCAPAGSEVSRQGCLKLGTESSPALPGFATELTIRNMEYNQVWISIALSFAIQKKSAQSHCFGQLVYNDVELAPACETQSLSR